MQDKGLDNQRMKKPAASKRPKKGTDEKPRFAIFGPDTTAKEIMQQLGLGAKKK